MKKVKVILIGYGHLGKWHAQKAASLENAELVAIIDKLESNQNLAKTNHPQVKVLGNYNDIINEFEAALIVTPTSSHFNISADLIKKKKHIFCEKPLCSNSTQGKELESLAKENNSLVQVGHSERFHEVWNILQIELEKIESPFSVEFKRESTFKGRATDVDVIQDLAIHDIDLFYFLFNKEMREIDSCISYKAISSFLDYTDIRFTSIDGDKIRIVSSRQSAISDRSVKITHNQGEIYVDLMNFKYSIFKDGELIEKSFDKRDHLLEEQAAFYKSILDKKAPVVSIADGVRAVELMEQMIKACES